MAFNAGINISNWWGATSIAEMIIIMTSSSKWWHTNNVYFLARYKQLQNCKCNKTFHSYLSFWRIRPNPWLSSKNVYTQLMLPYANSFYFTRLVHDSQRMPRSLVTDNWRPRSGHHLVAILGWNTDRSGNRLFSVAGSSLAVWAEHHSWVDRSNGWEV